MDKTIPRTEWLKLVAEEIEAIKKNADVMEKLGLSSTAFNPHSSNQCIYGQLTGGCRSVRGMELITLCCKSYVENKGGSVYNKNMSLSEKFEICEHVDIQNCKYGYFSNLEAYLFSSSEIINFKILDYIKGQTDKFPELT